MNKQEFVERLAEKAGFTKKDARKMIDTRLLQLQRGPIARMPF